MTGTGASQTCPYCGWSFEVTQRHRAEAVLPYCSHGCRLATAGTAREPANRSVTACADDQEDTRSPTSAASPRAAALAALLACSLDGAQAAMVAYTHALILCNGKARKLAILGAIIAAGGDLRRPNCRKVAAGVGCKASELRKTLREIEAHPVLGSVLLRRHGRGRTG